MPRVFIPSPSSAAQGLGGGVSSSFTFFCVLAFIGLIGLGIWQLKRHVWKEDLLASIATHQQMPPINLPAEAANINDDAVFRQFTAEGYYLHQDEIVVQGKTMNGTRGVYVVTPMVMYGQKILLVNRGWIPETLSHGEQRRGLIFPGFHKVHGVIWRLDRPAAFLPQNKPAKGLWLWMDQRMVDYFKDYYAQKFPNTTVIPYIVRMTVEEREGKVALPVPPPVELNVPNDHLQYAATWFILAGIVLVMYVIYYRKNVRKEA
jgi:surfeit locus 1 family protein